MTILFICYIYIWVTYVSELNHSFPLIGLSEIKISHGKDLLVYVNLSGYGVVFYIKNDFKYIIITEFTNLLMTLKPYDLKLIFIINLSFYVEWFIDTQIVM